MNAKARSLLSLVCVGALCLPVAGCGEARPEAVTAIKTGSTPLERWRYDAARAVTSLLAPQKSGVAVLEPTVDPSIGTELSAALALGPDTDSTAIAKDVIAGFDSKAGLFREGGKVSERLTWLAVRWLTSEQGAPILEAGRTGNGRTGGARISSARIVVGLQKRGQILVQAQIPDDESAFAYLNVLRSLDLLGSRYAGPAPGGPVICARLKSADGRKDWSGVATWVELSARLRTPCESLVASQQLLVDLSTSDQPAGKRAATAVEAAREYALVSAQRFLGVGVAKPGQCGAILAASNPTFLPDITASTYLLCSDAYRMSGTAVRFSPASKARLEREIVWRGRLPASVRFNSLAIVQSLYALRSLQFRGDVLQGIGQQDVVTSSDPSAGLDTALVAIARGSAGIDAGAQDRLASAAPDDLMYDGMLAIVAVQSDGCGTAMVARLEKSVAKNAGENDVRALLYRALVAKALDYCGQDGLASGARRDISARASQQALSAGPKEVVNVWRIIETRCTLGETPGIAQPDVLALLPQPGAENWSGYTLFAGVRLTDIATKGCGSNWWSAA